VNQVVPPTTKKYRHSIVFVLRAHSPIKIDTDSLTTTITGEFQKPMRGITAGDLYKSIHGSHFNINTNIEDREKQKQKLKQKTAAPS